MTIFGLRIGNFFFAVLASFLAGIIAADLKFSTEMIVSAAASFSIIFLVARFEVKIFVFLIPLIFLFLGFFYGHIYASWLARSTNLVFNAEVSFQAIATEEPALSSRSMLFRADAQKPFQGEITILAPPGSTIHYGDLLFVRGKILVPEGPDDGDGFVYLPNIRVVSSGHGFWIREKLIAARLGMEKVFQFFLSSDDAGFLQALTFADKSGIWDSLKVALASSGTSYLLAMYGWKIGGMAFFIEDLFLGWFDRRIVFCVSLLSIVCFFLMTTEALSAVRAVLMVSCAIFARFMGWRSDAKNILISSVFLISLFDPEAIITDIGFILSFMSVVGVLYLSPALRKSLHLHGRGFLGWKDSVLMALGAQLAIMPIVGIFFGAVPLVGFLPGTFIFLSLPITMLCGWLLGIGGPVFYVFGLALGEVLHIFLGIDIWVVYFFGALPVRAQLPFGYWPVVFLYYSFFVWFAWRYHPRP
jgi:competence protein ComEC